MTKSVEKPAPSAWGAIYTSPVSDHRFEPFILVLDGGRDSFQAIAPDDWVAIFNDSAQVIRVGRILRIRSETRTTTLYFDRVSKVEPDTALKNSSLLPPTAGKISRIKWTDFESDVNKLLQKPIQEIPTIVDQAYIRELLQLSVMDDLLGPAGGPDELIVDMGVRDRYLVGKLAPRETQERGQDFPVVSPDDDEPDQGSLTVKAQNPAVNSPASKGKGETESADEVDAASNQSLVPSSLGMTFCVDGDVEQIEIEVLWGRYERLENEDHEQINPKGQKVKVWQRIPCGGILVLPLVEGVIQHQAPDHNRPEVRLQGSVRARNINGDRLVTLFLVNAQEEPPTNRDSAWVLQPELIARAMPDSTNRAIFRRRPVLDPDGSDIEREALEMIYRNRVEFAVGHGVAVHAETSDDVTLATEVRTVVMPQYEVQVTETPGSDSSDRPAMKEMLSSGLLDMQNLAKLELNELINALNVLTKDYAEWIEEQRGRINADVRGHNTQAHAAIARCELICLRLQQGIDTLKGDKNALNAFRFANNAMATQRVRSQYALEIRRGKDVTVQEFDIQKNRSWRPFQLAFLLLSIPSLADPLHPDRVEPIDAYADLLWFPTGGGKTEAYLGVAAFTMAIRRMQKNFGGYDGSRGLSVIMRYTLRLLTLQQFQRATALICAMEVLRRTALSSGDESLGVETFSIGLWVGNNVTPGTTENSHEAIVDARNPNRYNGGSASPAQLTSCPWCGSEIKPERDVKVDRGVGRTLIFCGDPLKRCDFAKGDGIPVLTVDEEIYRRPPSMMIATVDKFAMMSWRGQVRTLFGKASKECTRHGLVWPGCECNTGHRAGRGLPTATVNQISPIRPPDLIIQDEFHLISGPLGTMVGLYETAVDELCSWKIDKKLIKPKVIASTATVRKADAQVRNVFMRRVSVFPPHGLDVEDNYFSIQRSIEHRPGRRYLGVCSPGSSRPAMLIRVYTAFLTGAQELFNRFGEPADPYMTMVGYFNSLRELGGMKRLAEDDVQTRAFRVQMSMVGRPALAQRNISNIRELTSRVSSQDIPKYLDQLEVKFKAAFDAATDKYVTRWDNDETRAIDVVLATNMLSVGVDVNRLGLMAVNGQPKGTAEYIQATSRVGRAFPGLVCTVLTWARPRDLSHYETFEHYHATFYKHVEAQSVTPFSPRAMDRGLTGTLLSIVRLDNEAFSPNDGASQLSASNQAEMTDAIEVISNRAWNVSELSSTRNLSQQDLKKRADEWAKKASIGGRTLAYEKHGPQAASTVPLIRSPGLQAWDNWTVPMSMREVEPGVRLIMNKDHITDSPDWKARVATKDED